jgi:hypothetical protein
MRVMKDMSDITNEATTSPPPPPPPLLPPPPPGEGFAAAPGGPGLPAAPAVPFLPGAPGGKGLHSSTSQLNVRTVYGTHCVPWVDMSVITQHKLDTKRLTDQNG